MDSIKRTARLAGLLYMLMAIPAAFGLLYVPGRLIVHGDAAATAQNLLASESLFRLGIASELFSVVIFLLLALALYRLFEGVSRGQAALMAVLVAVQVPIAFLNQASSLAALVVVRDAGSFAAFDEPQQDALAMLLLRLHDQGTLVCEVFWGLWLLPLGSLVYRSRFLPRFLGVWLILAGLAYLAMSLTGLLLPQYQAVVSRVTFPLLLGEIAFMLWLLIVGARPQPTRAPATA